MILNHPIPTDCTARAAALYWDAFGPKLGKTLGPKSRGIAFTTRVFDPTHGISAHAPDGTLLGVAGFKTSKGALVGGGFSDLKAIFGTFGALWRAALLSLLERDIENERFLMDGIFVSPKARGLGVGTALMQALFAEGQARGYREIRLDVIDANPRARALYERLGFVAIKTDTLGPLRHVFGFSTSTTMVKPLTDA